MIAPLPECEDLAITYTLCVSGSGIDLNQDQTLYEIDTSVVPALIKINVDDKSFAAAPLELILKAKLGPVDAPYH